MVVVLFVGPAEAGDMKYFVVLLAIGCLVAFAKSEPERLSNGKLVPTEATSYTNDVKSKKSGKGKLESIKKKKVKDKKRNKK